MNTGQGLIKHHHTVISSMYRLADPALVFITMIVSCQIMEVSFTAELQRLCISAAFLFYIVADQWQLYRSWRLNRVRKEVAKLWQAWIVGLALATGLHSLTNAEINQSVITLWGAMNMLALMLWRGTIRKTLHFIRSRGYNTRTVAIFGVNQRSLALAETIRPTWMGLRLVGFYDDRNPRRLEIEASQLEGDFRTLIEDIRAGKIEVAFISLPFSALTRIRQIELEMTDQPIVVYLVPDLESYHLFNSRWLTLGDMQLLSLHDSPQRGVNAALKRAEDIVLSTLFIILLSPLMLAIAVMLKLSGSPVFFSQTRGGVTGKPIQVLKFCSMRPHEPGQEIVQAQKNDPRVTRLGRILRRTSADELPQLFNVFAGSMSIVGPRPHATTHNTIYRKKIHRYTLRHLVKPGITGWAQINGCRGETDTDDKMAARLSYDLDYINRWSVGFDLKIILLTLIRIWKDPNAY